ncbi:MAG: penicillin-binding protein 1C, partial [Polyangiaceae bacterium]
AVWVGNFDGSAMRGTSGITGAAPLFHAAMEAAMRGRQVRPLRLSADQAGREGLESVEVCSLSGQRAGSACPHRVSEWVPRQARAGLEVCTMHERARVDRRNGLRAGPRCPDAEVVERTFERYDDDARAWAVAAGRPVAPERFSPLCPGALAGGGSAPRIGWPRDGARFVLDPERPRQQQRLTVRLEAPPEAERVELLVDGRAVARVGAPFLASWVIVPGEHVLVARGPGGATSAPVSVEVE